MQYVYPAIFNYDPDDGGYFVQFVDAHNIFTSGETLYEAIYMAEDVLALMLVEWEEKGKSIPKASDIRDIKLDDPKSFVTLIKADTDEYRKMLANMPKNEDK